MFMRWLSQFMFLRIVDLILLVFFLIALIHQPIRKLIIRLQK